jgi:hypothetical protein
MDTKCGSRLVSTGSRGGPIPVLALVPVDDDLGHSIHNQVVQRAISCRKCRGVKLLLDVREGARTAGASSTTTTTTTRGCSTGRLHSHGNLQLHPLLVGRYREGRTAIQRPHLYMTGRMCVQMPPCETRQVVSVVASLQHTRTKTQIRKRPICKTSKAKQKQKQDKTRQDTNKTIQHNIMQENRKTTQHSTATTQHNTTQINATQHKTRQRKIQNQNYKTKQMQRQDANPIKYKNKSKTGTSQR